MALASVAFLIYFFFVLRREFGERAAWYSATILATSAGWLAYSHVAITDLPMSAAFAAAMLALLPRPRSRAQLGHSASLRACCWGWRCWRKGWSRWRSSSRLFGSCGAGSAIWRWCSCGSAVIAAPWYVLVTLRNGAPFLEEFIWKHHFGRFFNSALQHGQPVWFYVPVLLAGLFPWTPLLALLVQRPLFQDARAQFLLAWFAWGFVFFSVSRNKLPGYLLPLLPPVAALMGIAIAQMPARSVKIMLLLAASAALLCLVPPLEDALPQMLAGRFVPHSFSAGHAVDGSRASGWPWLRVCARGPDTATWPLRAWQLSVTVTVV